MHGTFSSHLSRNGERKPSRLILGGICDDQIYTVQTLQIDGKSAILARRRMAGGGAANSAISHRLLAPEKRIILVAATGNDEAGRVLRREMAAHEIDMPWPPIPGCFTSLSLVISEHATGTGTILFDLGAREVPLPMELIERELPAADACCLVSPTVNEQIAPMLRLAARHEVPVFFGLGSMQVQKLSHEQLHACLMERVELLICNRKEAATISRCSEIEEQLEALSFGGTVRTVVITDGSAGIHALQAGERYQVPAYRDPQRPIVDEVGAGDAAQATIVDFLLHGYPLELALLAGARQGFEACTALGATTHLLDGVALREYLSMAVEAVG